MQLRAMLTLDFKFVARRTHIMEHITCYQTLIKYIKRLLGKELHQPNNLKLLTYISFPKA